MQRLPKVITKVAKQHGDGHGERIQHALAAYDSAGKLSCKVCKLTIKPSPTGSTKTMWAVHLRSNLHKEV